MTTIHFQYTDSYNNPSRGSLAFMPHRRHAANETEVLPKPFTISLLHGEVTVNLQPNSSSWVWIVTEYFEGVSTSFYTTIPDRDGVMEHTELVHINPSSIPAPYDAVEPAWWAEMRQYKATVTDTLLQAGEALEKSESALAEGAQNRDESRQSAANAKAYYEQSRDSAYESKEYRDQSEAAAVEAERQADRAASGPESAAGRAETAALEAGQYRDETRVFRDAAQSSANDARDDAQTANNHSSSANTSATTAVNARNDAESFRDTAKQYRDDILAEPESLEQRVKQYHDATEGARDAVTLLHSETREYRDIAQTAVTSTQNYRDEASDYATSAQGYRDEARALIRSGIMVLHNSTQTIDAKTRTKIVFNNIETEGDALSTDDNSFITVESPGWYAISTHLRFDANVADTRRQVRIFAGDHGAIQSSSDAGISVSLAAVQLFTGDTIVAEAYTDHGDQLTSLATIHPSLRVVKLA